MSDEPKIFDVIQRRIDDPNYIPTGPTYGELKLDTESQKVAEAANRMGYEAGRRRGIEDSARIADEFFPADSSKRKWGLAISRAIRRAMGLTMTPDREAEIL